MNQEYPENTKKKHDKDAKYGGYRYDVGFALSVYIDRNEKCMAEIKFYWKSTQEQIAAAAEKLGNFFNK